MFVSKTHKFDEPQHNLCQEGSTNNLPIELHSIPSIVNSFILQVLSPNIDQYTLIALVNIHEMWLVVILEDWHLPMCPKLLGFSMELSKKTYYLANR